MRKGEKSVHGLANEVLEGDSPEDFFWFAVRTRSRHEKLVVEQLSAKDITHFLPLIETKSRWSDRWKLVHVPLFPGYLFTRITLVQRIEILETRGVVEMVGSNGKPWPVPSDEVEAVRIALESKLKCDPYPYLKEGMQVEVVKGPLKDFRGILVKKHKRHKLILSVSLIGRSVSVEINAGDVVAV